MTVEVVTPSPVVRARPAAISWPAIFAALAVGIAAQLLLTLAGFAVGVMAAQRGVGSTETITLAALGWSAISMLIAALLGGYVAGRGSGLRRRSDGVMHGLVSWAASTLLYAALATTAIGGLTTGLFGLLAPSIAANNPAEQMSGNAQANEGARGAAGAAGAREQAMRALTDIGLSPDEAGAVVDRIFRSESVAGRSQAARRAARGAGSATLWLAATAVLSLLLAILGGAGGSRALRRKVRTVERPPAVIRAEPRVLTRT